jgi:16S rRNA (uracil1498-N3)-methyltransferase
MPRLFVPPELLRGPRAILDANAHRHLVKVLRLGPGAELRVFDGLGHEIDARIVAVEKAAVEIALGERRRLPASPCTVTLLIAPPRGERMDFVVQKTTELGVARIVPVTSARAMIRPTPQQPRRWRIIAQEAARQSGRADVPEVAEPAPFAEALAGAAAGHERCFLLWEGEHRQSLHRALQAAPRSVALLVGPEGGFAADEAARAVAAGFTAVGLGPRILRSETAAMVAVALAQAASGGLDE